jgi:drug/metabolite transporter (DMT)-like permease
MKGKWILAALFLFGVFCVVRGYDPLGWLFHQRNGWVWFLLALVIVFLVGKRIDQSHGNPPHRKR